MNTTILIIDDEEGIRKVLGLSLADAGYTVLTAARARDGLEIFRSSKPDVVLTDLIMPGRGGCETLRVIKEESPDTPVILLTGMGKREVQTICSEYPDVTFVAKPIDAAALEEVLRKAVRRPRQDAVNQPGPTGAPKEETCD